MMGRVGLGFEKVTHDQLCCPVTLLAPPPPHCASALCGWSKWLERGVVGLGAASSVAAVLDQDKADDEQNQHYNHSSHE